MLFDDIKRTDLGPAKRSESHFDYLNRSAEDEIVQCREHVEKMYSLFPENKDVRGRLRSEDNIVFISAFTELYFQTLFSALDFEVTIHPKKEGTSSRPDWLLTKNSGEELYCEATASFPEKYKRSATKHQDRAIDYLRDNLENGTRLSIHFRGYPKTSLKPSQLKKEIQTQIDEKKSSAEKDSPDMESSTELSEFTSDSIDRVFVRRPKLEGVSGAVISMGSGVEVVTVAKRIRRRLRQKAKKYGQLKKPFIIALNIQDSGPTDDFHIKQALVGDFRVRNVGQVPSLICVGNGFWGDPTNKKYTRVSGILVVDRLSPFTVDRSEVTLWHNPFAQIPISRHTLPFRQKVMPDPESPNFDTIPQQLSSFELLRRIL